MLFSCSENFIFSGAMIDSHCAFWIWVPTTLFSQFSVFNFTLYPRNFLIHVLSGPTQVFKQGFILFFIAVLWIVKCNLLFGKPGLPYNITKFMPDIIFYCSNPFIQHWADLNLGMGAGVGKELCEYNLKKQGSFCKITCFFLSSELS